MTDITAINAKTISVGGVPIVGSAAATGPVTRFTHLDADAVLALNGAILLGSLPPGGVFTNYTDIDVGDLSVNETPYPALPAAFLTLWRDNFIWSDALIWSDAA